MSGHHGICSEWTMPVVGVEALATGGNQMIRTIPAVRLEKMPQQVGVLRPEEDWTGLSSPKMRRRLQNRLNYRAWKRRQNESLNSDTSVRTSSINEMMTRNLIYVPDKLIYTLCSLSLIGIEARMVDFERAAFYSYSSGSPRTDLLFNLTQFNVMRALFINMAAIGYSQSLFADDSGKVSDTVISPLSIPGASLLIQLTPSHLQPTSLQLTVKHHPWIDLWPFPKMRDNILSCGEEYDDTELCLDLVENYCVPSGISGFRVWGDPWIPGSWEMSEEFLSKWGWVVAGCSELFIATDYWRQRRGEGTILGSCAI